MILRFLREIFNWNAGPSPFPENTDGLKKSVSVEEAAGIFAQLAGRKDIAFRYAPDGCYARAHLMCRQIFEMGIVPKKAWALEDDQMLKVRRSGQRVDWVFHVAPVIPVEMPEGIVDMVFDPSLFDGPVTLEKWGKSMRADLTQLEIQPVGKPPAGMPGDYTTDEKTSSKTDARARKTMDEYLPLQEPEGSVRPFMSGFNRAAAKKKPAPKPERTSVLDLLMPQALPKAA